MVEQAVVKVVVKAVMSGVVALAQVEVVEVVRLDVTAVMMELRVDRLVIEWER